ILRPFKKIRSFVEGMKEGNLITLRHIDNILSTYDVTLLGTLSQMFDPKFMRAVGVQSEEDLPSGLVLEEVRKGFLWRNEVLRVADVKVNKIP
ncbi:MAG: nucleotide exchange factor GrpE, partial [Alphaproteobacteria bacterium]|nr:nucleotide exchange factor GrpE [Alphaproteobacteria bacterium]